MKKKAYQVPLLTLQTATAALSGLRLRRLDGRNKNKSALPKGELHRDNYFVLVFQKSGTTEFMLDFEMVRLQGASLMCIQPGSIHQYLNGQNMQGWLLGLDPAWLGERLRSRFYELAPGASIPLHKEAVVRQLEHIACALHLGPAGSIDPAGPGTIEYLASAFASVFLENFETNFESDLAAKKTSIKNTRPAALVSSLRHQIIEHHRLQKTPAWYAAQCHLSLSYLNECAKAVTGYSVSKLIHQQTLLEAKRMLAHGDLSFKEIAYQLGQQDPAYFNRVFFKTTGMRPTAFRKMYRK